VHSDGKVNATNKIYGQRNGLSTCLYRSAKWMVKRQKERKKKKAEEEQAGVA
jgi:hypothetical protein